MYLNYVLMVFDTSPQENSPETANITGSMDGSQVLNRHFETFLNFSIFQVWLLSLLWWMLRLRWEVLVEFITECSKFIDKFK